MTMRRTLSPWLLLLAAGLLPLAPLQAQQAPGETAAARSRAPVTVNFVNADIEAVTRAFAAMIGRQIAVDPRVKGSITVYSEQPISVREAYLTFLSSLRGLGFAMVDNGGLLKVVPEADAKVQTGTVSVGPVGPRGDQVITQIFHLQHQSPNNLVAVLRPLITANNTINANPGSNSLIITDYADNLRRLAQIVAALDRPSDIDLDLIPLKHAVASDVVTLVQRLVGASATPTAPAQAAAQGGQVTVLAEPRSNALLVRAPNAARLSQVRAVIAQLDVPSAGAGPAGGIWVINLKNADAVRLATVLRAAFAGGSGSSAGTSGLTGGAPAPAAAPVATTGAGGTGASAQATAPVSGAAAPSTGGFIQADPATNSLIVSAPEPLYRQVRAMIDQLDQRRAQVYIESMIVEVAGGDATDFGFDWLGTLGSNRVVAAQSLVGDTGKPGIVSVNTGLATGAITVGSGLNVGLARTINGITSLTTLLRLLQSQSKTNIVSTPNLITLDNEEAKIVVGKNVPFVTGQFTSTGTATNNPFQTIERKDVGITLRIKPQIGEGGAIRMQIYQEQSAVTAPEAGTANAGPSTTKRSIEGTVTVDDGQILVLGGLIEDNYTTTQSKVPLLGDIPFLGALFRSENRERKRTNLMVFLRPIVMRDADAQARFSLDRYEQIRANQTGSQPSPNVLLPVDRSPVLPPNVPGQPTPPAPYDPPPAASVPAASNPAKAP